MANPRDHIRAAQAAELRGDKAAAIAELWKAAALYRRAGNLARALQILSHARSLDPSRADLAEEVSRIERLPDPSLVRALHGEESEAGEGVRELKTDPGELAERQRLIEEALQQVDSPGAGGEARDEVSRGSVEEPPGGDKQVDLQDASRKALDWARLAREEEEALLKWSGPGAAEPPPAHLPMMKSHPSDVGLEVKPLGSEDVTALVADVESDSYGPPFEGPTTGEEPRSEERALIERGPTRADPALDAWCSFCCRPRVEVGELVAGPTGSFICATCLGEAQWLLGLQDTAPARPRPARRKSEQPEGVEFIGQDEARTLLEQALQAGARRLLVIGPEGTGKTVWFRELARQERGTIVSLEVLEQGGGGSVVLVEDVDRLPLEDSERLGALLARYPERTVIMSSRGEVQAPSLSLSGPAGSLPVFTTDALFQAVLGGVPVSLLDQVQVALMLRAPTEAEFVELARRLLASRAAELTVSEDVLAAFAREAARSPRAGYELNALLARVLDGAWSLPGREKQKQARGKKGAAKKSTRRGRRKGKE